MDTAKHVLDPMEDTGHYVCVLAGARGASDVIAAVRDYLAAWPQVRVANVQRVDGGWAPFDASQQPIAPDGPTDLRKTCDAVRAQCASLEAAGVAPAPELRALDRFLSLACARLAEIEPEPAPRRPSLAGRQPAPRVHR